MLVCGAADIPAHVVRDVLDVFRCTYCCSRPRSGQCSYSFRDNYLLKIGAFYFQLFSITIFSLCHLFAKRGSICN